MPVPHHLYQLGAYIINITKKKTQNWGYQIIQSSNTPQLVPAGRRGSVRGSLAADKNMGMGQNLLMWANQCHKLSPINVDKYEPFPHGWFIIVLPTLLPYFGE